MGKIVLIKGLEESSINGDRKWREVLVSSLLLGWGSARVSEVEDKKYNKITYLNPSQVWPLRILRRKYS